MRFIPKLIFGLLPLAAAAENPDSVAYTPQPNIYFSKPAALAYAGVKWVNSMFRDSRGLTWFCTSNGLFRFDGTNVLYVRHKTDDSLTLPSNDVQNIAEDKEGFMWVGTTAGAARMDPNTFSCERLRLENGYSPGYKFKFYVDGQDNVWGATDVGLYKLNRKTNKLKLEWTCGEDNYGIGHVVTGIASYSKDELAISTLVDVVLYNKQTKAYKRIPVVSHGRNSDLSKIYIDKDGEMWVGTWGGGIHHFNKHTQTFTDDGMHKILGDDSSSVIYDMVKVQVGDNQFLYAATSRSLVKIALQKDGYTPTGKTATAYLHDDNSEGSLMVGSISSLFEDESGNLWIGAMGDVGVAKISLSETLVNTLNISHRGAVAAIQYIEEGGRRLYTISSWHGDTGLVVLNENLQAVKTIPKFPENGPHDAVNVSSVSVDGVGRLWVSSWRGIYVMDKDFKIVGKLDNTTRGPDTLFKAKNNYALISNDTVWIADYKQGIDLFSTQFKRLKHYSTADNNGLREDLIWRFYRAHSGTIWLIGNAFLYRFNPATETFTPFYFSNDHEAYNPVGMAERKDGSLLVATGFGLVHFYPGNGQYEYIRSPLLDKEDNINVVETDENDNAWYLTDEHVVHYNFANNIFTLYGKQDGIDIAGGLIMMHYLGNNRLLIGQNDKVILFTAPGLAKKVTAPGLIVTGISVNDSLAGSALPTNGLTLKYDQNRINITFACVNYAKPEQNIFAYRLKNTDSAWTLTRQGNVSFANLSPGHYVFEVRAANYALMWSPIAAIAINIAPPFWQTWWFRSLVLAAAILATYIIFRRRVAHIRREEKIKASLSLKMTQLEMKALRAQMNPHFVFNSLSSIQESIVTGKTDAASKYLSKFSRLIRLILENSGKQFISLKTEIESLTLYLELESFRFENFTYTISIDPAIDAYFAMIPSMIIQPFVENALKHGLSKKKDDKHLKIDIRKEQGQLVAIVEDNGIGREKAKEMKSLERRDHHSMGIEITEERLQLLGMQSQEKGTVITDLYDKDGNSAGTLIRIILPLES